MRLIIKSLTIEGFKSVTKAREYTLPLHSVVEGDNCQGKTSIGDAITYCLYGCAMSGSNKIDPLINKTAKAMTVGVYVEMDGQDMVIVRSRRGSATTVTIDGRKANQDELSRLLPPKDVFLAIFNPAYFLSLSEGEGRQLIAGYLKTVSKQEVLDSLSEPERDVLAKPFLDINIYMAELKDEVKACETDITKAQGAIEQYQQDLSALRKTPMAEVDFDSTQIPLLTQQLEALRKSKREQTGQLNEQKQALQQQLMALRYSQPQLEQVLDIAAVWQPNSEIVQLSTQLDRLRMQWVDKQHEAEGIASLGVSQTCPVCRQAVGSEHINSILAHLQAEAQAITADAERIKQQLSVLQMHDDASYQQLTETNEWAKQHNQAATEAHNQATAAQRQALEAELSRLDQAVESLYGDQDVKALESQLSALHEEKQKAALHNQAVRQQREQQKALEDKIAQGKASIKADTAEIQRLNLILSAAKNYGLKQVELQAGQLRQYLDKADIRLKKIIKTTGEIKDCFEVTYDGRTVNQLSASERIRAGLEISALLKGLTGHQPPVFVDNAESITSTVWPTDGQAIQCRVVKDMPLTIREG